MEVIIDCSLLLDEEDSSTYQETHAIWGYLQTIDIPNQNILLIEQQYHSRFLQIFCLL